MNKIKKYQLIQFLNVFKEKKCKTIDDIINLLNKELKKDDDTVFSWKVGK